MSESFLEKSKAFEGVYFADAYQLNTKALDGVIFVKKEELVGLAREADAALAEVRRAHDLTIGLIADYKVREKQLEGRIDRLTALNTAKGELIEFYEGYWTASERPYHEANLVALRARIRSLENE